MMPDAQEEINVLSDRLRESHRKLTEALLEVVERRDTTDIGELRRRLYVAERHGFVKLAAMWRQLIEKAREGG